MQEHAHGSNAREQGAVEVLKNAGIQWRIEALECLRLVCMQKPEFTSEDFRKKAEEMGLPPPHHHNAWGAVMRAGAGRGFMKATGRYVRAVHTEAHSRMVQVWASSYDHPALVN